MPEVRREPYVEIPEEDREEGDGDCVGRLNRNMYGFRDASNGWQDDWQQLLKSVGYKVGVANPALFQNPNRAARGAVHGDDFYVLGPKSSIDHLGEVLRSKYSVRESHRLGWGNHCVREATVLNRVVTLGLTEDNEKFVRIVPDQRHVQIILKTLGFNSRTKSCVTPSVKLKHHEIEARRLSPSLPPAEISIFRPCGMRASFLSQDRADIGESVKSLAQGMAKPTRAYYEDLKRLGRYLLSLPHLALVYKQQRAPSVLTVNVDSDHAADKMTRKSTTGMTIVFGKHLLKSSSNLQSSIGLNVAEAEFYALRHGGAHSLGMQSFFRDLGIKTDLEICSDSSSAGSFSSRRGLGKQRHVQTRYLWIQERVSCRHFRIKKIRTENNTSDILTKSSGAQTSQKHMRTLGFASIRPSKLQKAVQQT